ncbi:branched-chain amino acid ABC transporter permease [Pusillimonas noertemannii]|uniref:Branched-chain amino acid transport system permease protein n=1 Tax=Pusillimonas noertemannii TaxID=305977 RepID=A0A2U1CNL9_9BURK|nr:branched-chain amino acid ABC transporter permease [Pusillimonas noertemannii]NYT68436.1 branched-chain amino acid ABC transporter permease [Pusillimonas noertemannii]PVY62547.1 branched-chain amino acid transport system permease protein [Pusillimonas noertemannii]TFL10501.1 branched-chain amino acid ABC transporter permease [Pusillimonas noertemannii]
MDLSIGILLFQDGLTNGAIYMLLALALVLVFSVTRVLFLPQGEFVVFGALGFTLLNKGQMPGTVWLLLVFGVLAAISDIGSAATGKRLTAARRTLVANLALPALLALLAWIAARNNAPPLVCALLAIALVIPLGPMIYRIAFMPVAQSSILTLLIVGVTVHFVLLGMSLFFFGPEGMRAQPLLNGDISFGEVVVSAQSLLVYAASAAVVAGLYYLFEHTVYGKALRATSVSRTGARLSGIRTHVAGKLAFGLAAAIGAVCGVLLVSLTTVYYDSGLAIGMRGFIGAVVGALVSFPGAAVGALMVGVIEAFTAFFYSSLKDAALFLLIIPVLLYLSLGSGAGTVVSEEES